MTVRQRKYCGKRNIGFSESLGEKGVQIISKDVKIETKCNGWVAHGELVVQEKVGTQGGYYAERGLRH